MIRKEVIFIILCSWFNNYGFVAYGFIPQTAIKSIAGSIPSQNKCCNSKKNKIDIRYLNNSESDDNTNLLEEKKRDEKEEKQEKARLEVWLNRRKQIRATLKFAEQTRFSRIQNGTNKPIRFFNHSKNLSGKFSSADINFMK